MDGRTPRQHLMRAAAEAGAEAFVAATAPAADECIAIEDLMKATKVFAVAAIRFLGLHHS